MPNVEKNWGSHLFLNIQKKFPGDKTTYQEMCPRVYYPNPNGQLLPHNKIQIPVNELGGKTIIVNKKYDLKLLKELEINSAIVLLQDPPEKPIYLYINPNNGVNTFKTFSIMKENPSEHLAEVRVVSPFRTEQKATVRLGETHWVYLGRDRAGNKYRLSIIDTRDVFDGTRYK